MVLTRQQSLLSLQVLQLNLVEASLPGVSLQSQLSSRQSAEGISRIFFLHFRDKAGTKGCHPRPYSRCYNLDELPGVFGKRYPH